MQCGLCSRDCRTRSLDKWGGECRGVLWSVECEVKSVKSVKTVKTVKTVIWSVESGVCSVWSMDCAIGVAECEVEWRVWMWSVECGMKAVKCEAFSVKCGVESRECQAWSVQ